QPSLGSFRLWGCASASAAVYKQWIPNTNFETASNWDKGRVPCATLLFDYKPWWLSGNHTVTLHPFLQYLPLNGELVLAAGAAFTAFDGTWDPGCGTVRFTDAEHRAWFDPTLWQDVLPSGELKPSGPLFSVDEERVPCRHDDVVFLPETSFRVNTDSAQAVIHLRSISVMGQVRWQREKLAPHLLTFHGNATLQVTGAGCPDKSGCACGNAADGPRICAALLGAGRQCPEPACPSPLQPLGHCCGVCGATINLDFTPDFDLQKYQDRLVQELLSQPKYAGVQMAMSKVHKAQTFLGILPRSSTPLIQIVLVDDRAGVQAGTAAEQLAAAIMEDIAQHGNAPVTLGSLSPSGSPAGAPGPTAGQGFVSPASSPQAHGVKLSAFQVAKWRWPLAAFPAGKWGATQRAGSQQGQSWGCSSVSCSLEGSSFSTEGES
uniref:Protein amnionless n=1 Tax=Malurus cyaneus samueli TaxID=2593467 RepID=A0A8C5U4H7_9PASS